MIMMMIVYDYIDDDAFLFLSYHFFSERFSDDVYGLFAKDETKGWT